MHLSPSVSPACYANVSRTMPTVFVVDDDVSAREYLQLLIRAAGWQPETFPARQEFITRPRAPSPSCLVCDITLPDLNGFELQQLVASQVKSRSFSSPPT